MEGNSVVLEIPEWSIGVKVSKLNDAAIEALQKFLTVSPNIRKKPGGVNCAFIAACTTDPEGNLLWQDEKEILSMLSKNPAVITRLMNLANKVNPGRLEALNSAINSKTNGGNNGGTKKRKPVNKKSDS